MIFMPFPCKMATRGTVNAAAAAKAPVRSYARPLATPTSRLLQRAFPFWLFTASAAAAAAMVVAAAVVVFG